MRTATVIVSSFLDYLAAERGALHESAGRAAHAAERAAHRGPPGAALRPGPAGDAPHPPPHVRDPYAGRGRRPATHPGAARSQPALHHPALHAREPRAADEGV